MRLTVSHSVRGTPKSTDFFPPVSLIASHFDACFGAVFFKTLNCKTATIHSPPFAATPSLQKNPPT